MNTNPPCGIQLPQGGIFLEKIYEVYRGEAPVGTACVTREGLYYRIQIQCDLPGDLMHKVLVRCNGTQEDLGILVPMSGQYGLTMRIPVKRLGTGELGFRVMPRHKPFHGHLVPLSPEEPFAYLHRLKDAFLVKQNGEIGLIFKQT